MGVEMLVKQIAENRAKMKARGLRTTEPTEAIFNIPKYDWNADPKNFKIDDVKPRNRCQHCGYKFLGWKVAPFCNICTFAMHHRPKDIMPELQAIIGARYRIPEEETEKQYNDRQIKRKITDEMKRKANQIKNVESDFKRATDLV